MTDWARIEIQSFDQIAKEDVRLEVLVGRLVLDRLPYAFDTKHEYLEWRDRLGTGLQVDARDVVLVGSAATGRSLSARSHFGVFNRRSDIDIAVVSMNYFEQAWNWFRRTNPQILGLDDYGQKLFEQHRRHYIFDGVVAANYFLGYFSFGAKWQEELQRSEEFLPPSLRGRAASVRIYRDSAALRSAQAESLRLYRRSLGKLDPIKAGPSL